MILFAHEGQKKSFIASFQHSARLYDHQLLTIDEFETCHFQINHPIISPDQRWLLIAKSILPEQRKMLTISGHRSAWAFSRRIFLLWMAAWESGQSFNEKDMFWEDWQKPWIKICREIRQNYKKNLEVLGYTDKIFLNIDRAQCVQGVDVILANIPLLAPNIKRLLASLRDEHVLAYHQGPAHWFVGDFADLKPMSEWSSDKGLIRTRQVTELSVSHESQEREILSSMSPVNAVDPRQKPLWINPRSLAMTRTTLFQFWKTWLSVFEVGSMTRLPLSLVKALLFNHSFDAAYAWSDDVKTRFWKAAEEGARWWDLKDFAPEKMLNDYHCLLKYNQISWEKLISRLPESLWVEPGIDEIRYQFGSVWESLKQSYYQQLIPSEAILEYLVDRLSGRVVKGLVSSAAMSRQPKDCLNVGVVERFFTGVMEGLVPSPVEAPWLLMPKQISAWGLWSPVMTQTVEAYAWTQALLTSEKAVVIIYQNAQDFRPPSLWTWLRESLPVQGRQSPDIEPVKVESGSLVTIEKLKMGGIPVKLADFGQKKLSFSAYDTWRNCPYEYALSKGYRLKISDPKELTMVNGAFMGQLAHDWLEVYMAELAKNISGWNHRNDHQMRVMAKSVWAMKAKNWPLNLEGVLIDKIIIPDLLAMAKGLIKCIDQQVGFDNILEMYPEEAEERLLSQGDGLMLGGRADLRIETKTGDYWVIDYKSGSDMDALQLNWYAALYYSHVHPSQIKLAFYNIPDRKFKLVKTQLEKLQDVSSDWQQAMSEKEQVHTPIISHCKYCSFGELCRK